MVFGFGGSSAPAAGAPQSAASVNAKMQEIKNELKQQVNAHNIKELFQVCCFNDIILFIYE
jgi:hypothetical protein